MIHYSLVCEKSHKFDGWFASAAAYDSQKSRGLVTCPICLTTAVDKALMAPSIARSGSMRARARSWRVRRMSARSWDSAHR